MKTQTTNRRWLAGLACVCAAALALWACKEDDPQPDPPTLSLSMSGATGATDAVSVSRADGTGDLQWPQGKTLGRTFTVALSAAAPGEVTVGLSIVRSDNVPAGSVALSPETVRIPAGQTTGTATVTVSDDAFLRAGGTFEVGVRTGAVSGAQAPTQPLEAKVVATVASFSPDLTMAVQGVGTGGADSFTATRSPDADCAVTFPEGKSLSRTVTLTLSAPATTDAVVSLSLTPNNLSEEQAKLSAATVTIAAGQTSGTATVSGPTSTDFMNSETTEKTYGWTVAVSAVEGITPPATLPRATVAVTVPACEKKEEPKEEECEKTKVTITYITSISDGVTESRTTETQCVEVEVDEEQSTYTFKQLKIDNVTKDWTVAWEELSGWSGLYGECTVTEGDSYEDGDNCWRYSISGSKKPTVVDNKVTNFEAAIGRLETENPEDLFNDDIVVIDRKIGEITIGE